MIEFLDTEWNNVKPFTSSEPAWKKYPNAFLLNTKLVEYMAQPNRIQEILLKDQNILEDLDKQIATDGICVPLILKLDGHSRITLYDGHHRLLIALERKIEAIPVILESCSSLSLKTVPVIEVLKWSLTSMKPTL